MKAAILAAGVGRRLGAVGRGTPKGLLKIGGQPLIERSIHILLDQGLEKIAIVVGFRADKYRYLTARYPQIELVHNEDYTFRGSMSSLECAYRWARSDLLFLDSDIIYDARGVEEVLNCPGPNVLLVSGVTGAGDEVWVTGSNQKVSSVGKSSVPPTKGLIGEFVGISRLAKWAIQEMIAQERHGQGGSPMDYEYFIDALVDQFEIRACPVRDLAWAEVDTISHLIRARRLAGFFSTPSNQR